MRERINKTIFLAIYAIFYSSIIQRYIWNNQFWQLLPDIIIIICILQNGLTNKRASNNSIGTFLGKWTIFLYILFFLIGIISDFINTVNPLSALWGIRMLIRYGILFLLVYKNFGLPELQKTRKIISITFYINAILIIFQFVTNDRGDSMGGIWIGNGELSLYMMLLTFIFSLDYFYKRLSLKQLLIRFSFFYITAMWAEIKMLYFILPLCIYMSYILKSKFSFKHIIILVCIWFLALPILGNVLSLYYGEEYVSQTLDAEKLQEYNENSYGFTSESINRGTIFEKSNIFLNSSIYNLIGHGLGSGTVSQYFSTDVFDLYKDTFYHYFTMSYLLMEVGYLGLCIFIIIHIILLYRFYIYYKSSKDYILKYWSSLGILSTIAAFIMIYYNSAPINSYYLGYLFWAICYIAIRERKLQLNKILHDS